MADAMVDVRPRIVEAHGVCDNIVWNILSDMILHEQKNRFHPQFKKNISQLGMIGGGIPTFAMLNRLIGGATKWQLYGVPRYGDDRDVFPRFAERRFPVLPNMRPRSEMDRAKTPDLFHDYWGHLWMLMDPSLAKLYEKIGQQSIGIVDTQNFKFLIHLYVNTLEFGLCLDRHNCLMGFGAAIASSPEEHKNALEGLPGDKKPLRIRFDPKCETDVLRIMRTKFHFSDLQKTYFVITDWDAFSRLLNADLGHYFDKLAHLGGLEPGETHPTDVYCS